MNDTTKAWGVGAYGPVESLALIDYPVARPGAGEVLIDVAAMALNPLDLKLISGQMKALMPVAMPFVPGSDVTGTVVAVGDGVDGLTPGQPIVASSWNGALARRALLPASAHVVAVPATANLRELAALPMAGLTALNILRNLGDVRGKTLAVIGATGGVGLALLQYAAAAGARLVASASGGDAERVTANGAHETIDYKAQPFVEELRRRHPGGVDMLVDLVSMFDTLLTSATAVRDGGVMLSTLFGPEPSAFGGRINVIYNRLKAEPGDLATLVDDYLGGRLRANVGATFDFAEAPAACLALRDRHIAGKIVVTM